MKMKCLDFHLEAKPEAESADLYIFDEIGEYEDWCGNTHGFGPKGLVSQLDECKQTKLKVHINSFGGSAYDGLAIMNLLKDSGKEVTTIIEGIAASAASLIAMSGSHIVMRNSSQLMIHNPWTYARGNSNELRAEADRLASCEKVLRRAYLDKAGDKLSEATLIGLLDAESYLTPEEAMSYGLCDEIHGKAVDPLESDPTAIEPEETEPDPEDKAEEIQAGATEPEAKKVPWFWD